jgi:hypothetical protein
MTTPTAGTAPDTVQSQTAAANGEPRQATGWRPTFTRAEIGFLIAVPLVWAVVLLFHGAPDPDDVYGSLQGEASRYLTVHLVSLVLLGLIGAALYLLLRDLPGRAARIGRLAIGPFVVFYVAGDAIAGVATGVLVEHANDLPASERAGTADAAHSDSAPVTERGGAGLLLSGERNSALDAIREQPRKVRRAAAAARY